MTLKDARARNLGSGDKPDYFQCKAVVHIVKQENAFYRACPQSDCNKKVVDEGNDQFRCEKCNALFPNFKYRLLINVCICCETFSFLTLNTISLTDINTFFLDEHRGLDFQPLGQQF